MAELRRLFNKQQKAKPYNRHDVTAENSYKCDNYDKKSPGNKRSNGR